MVAQLSRQCSSKEAAKRGISEASRHRACHERGFVAETESTFPRITYWRITARESLTSDG